MPVTLRRLFTNLENEVIRVDHDHLLIGRGSDCQLSPVSPFVSRRHSEITIVDGRVIVRDLGSTNGTYVNSERVEDARELRAGDVLNVGLAYYEIQIVDEAKTDREDSAYFRRLSHQFEPWTTPLSSNG